MICYVCIYIHLSTLLVWHSSATDLKCLQWHSYSKDISETLNLTISPNVNTCPSFLLIFFLQRHSYMWSTLSLRRPNCQLVLKTPATYRCTPVADTLNPIQYTQEYLKILFCQQPLVTSVDLMGTLTLPVSCSEPQVRSYHLTLQALRFSGWKNPSSHSQL